MLDLNTIAADLARAKVQLANAALHASRLNAMVILTRLGQVKAAIDRVAVAIAAEKQETDHPKPGVPP